MTAADLFAIAPLIVLAAGAAAVLLVIAFHRSHSATLALTLSVLATAMLPLPMLCAAPWQVGTLLVIDGFAAFFMGLILGAGILVALLSHGYLSEREGRKEEFYVLLLLATLGAAVLTASCHFASFFLGLELLSVALYAMIAYRREALGLEAGVKYLVLAAASAGFLVFGMAVVYSELGTMEFSRVASLLTAPGAPSGPVLLTGLAMMIVGMGFKLAVVPFHLWTPDVYQGAPAPVTAFVATVSKGAMFALLVRYFAQVDVHAQPGLVLIFSIIAAASMLLGNLLALLQRNVKRILAYSSIAHVGYLLVAFLAVGSLRGAAVCYYLLAYFVTTLGAFGVVGMLSGPSRDAEDLADYRGLAWRRPALAAVMTAMMLSLAGIPLTAGFVGKFFILSAGVQSHLWWLIGVMVVGSLIGLYYYLRVVVTMFSTTEERAPSSALSPPVPSLALSGGVALAAICVLLLWIGVYPPTFLDILRATGLLP